MREIGRTWSLAGIYLAVTKDSLDYHEHRYVKHAVLDTLYTDLQWFGSGEIMRDVRGVLLTNEHDTLVGYIGSGYHAFVSDQGAEGNYFLASMSATRLTATNYDTPVYRVTVKLKKELP